MNILDENRAIDALVNGYTELYGEKYLQVFKELGPKCVEVGKKNGTSYWHDKAIQDIHLIGLLYLKHTNGDKSIAKQQLMSAYGFTQQDIDLLNGTVEKHEQIWAGMPKYRRGIGPLQQEIMSAVREKDIKSITPKAFKYFEQFKTYSDKSSPSYMTESGFSLDSLNKDNIEYYRTENELFYFHEEIYSAFYLLGLYLTRQTMRQSLKEKIVQFAKQHGHDARGTIAHYYVKFFDHKDETAALIEIQKLVGKEDFETPKQISSSLKSMSKKRQQELIDLFKK